MESEARVEVESNRITVAGRWLLLNCSHASAAWLMVSVRHRNIVTRFVVQIAISTYPQKLQRQNVILVIHDFDDVDARRDVGESIPITGQLQILQFLNWVRSWSGGRLQPCLFTTPKIFLNSL